METSMLLFCGGLLILNYLYYRWIPLFDSYIYGYIYQKYIKLDKIPGGIFNKPFYQHIFQKFENFWRWLFYEQKSEGHTIVIRYRIFQKILEIVPNMIIILLLYLFLGWVGFIIAFFNLICILFTHYYMVYDFKFYELLNEIKYAQEMIDPHWLKKWYFLGKIIFNPYEYNVFKLSANLGKFYLLVVPIILLILSF